MKHTSKANALQIVPTVGRMDNQPTVIRENIIKKYLRSYITAGLV